jgi:hypothetical protein
MIKISDFFSFVKASIKVDKTYIKRYVGSASCNLLLVIFLSFVIHRLNNWANRVEDVKPREPDMISVTLIRLEAGLRQ